MCRTKNAACVPDMDGQPLMPIRRFGMVKRMLKDGRAKVVCRKPFAIQLNCEPETHIVHEVVLGIEPGRTNIGLRCSGRRKIPLRSGDQNPGTKMFRS